MIRGEHNMQYTGFVWARQQCLKHAYTLMVVQTVDKTNTDTNIQDMEILVNIIYIKVITIYQTDQVMNMR